MREQEGQGLGNEKRKMNEATLIEVWKATQRQMIQLLMPAGHPIREWHDAATFLLKRFLDDNKMLREYYIGIDQRMRQLYSKWLATKGLRAKQMAQFIRSSNALALLSLRSR